MYSNRQLFLNHVAQTSTAPLMLEIERAQGMYMYDVSGKKYLDLIAGISVSSKCRKRTSRKIYAPDGVWRVC